MSPPAGVHDPLDDGEQVEGRAGQAVDARHRYHVAGRDPLQQLQQLAPVGPRAAGLLAVNPAAPLGLQLLKLGIERLAIGADAGVSEAALWLCFGYILRKV